jgi:hypothetical protein
MQFSEFFNKTCGDNRISWWFTENHEDKGVLPPSMSIKKVEEIPERIWNSWIVRIGAVGNKSIDVGLAADKPEGLRGLK